MAKGPFAADQFVATKWSTAEDKAKFGNTFLHFVKSDFDRKLFTKSFYQRLSNCCSNIAHYDLSGFYNTWFERDFDRLAFLEHTLKYPCYGDPEFTFSDVERAIQIELKSLNLIPLYRQRMEAATRTRELRELERLKQKYESPSIPGEKPEQADPIVHSSEGRVLVEYTAAAGLDSGAIQGNLFE